jgi:hypothetical protein
MTGGGFSGPFAFFAHPVSAARKEISKKAVIMHLRVSIVILAHITRLLDGKNIILPL